MLIKENIYVELSGEINENSNETFKWINLCTVSPKFSMGKWKSIY